MFSGLSTQGLARTSTQHPKRVIGIWIAILVLAFISIGSFSTGTLTTEFAFFSNPDSKQGDALLADRLRGPANVNEVVIVRSTTVTVDDAPYEEFVLDLQREIVALGDSVASIVSYYQTDNPNLVSSDRLTTVLPLVMAGEFIEAEDNIVGVIDIVEAAAEDGVFEVFITGEATFSKDFADGNQEDAERGESFGIPIAMIILAVVFGALAAAILPIVMAIAAIIVAFGFVLLIGQAMQLQVFVQNIITMIGLAVGIDYSLLIVSRFREERSGGLDRDEAIVKVGRTAGKAVLFSGLTVIVAVLGLLIVPHRVYFSIGLGMITVLTIAVAAALTLLPALLRIMGDRVNKFRLPFIGNETTAADTGEFWDKISHGVMRRPTIFLVLAVGLLVAASIPFLDINTGTSGVSELPDKFQAKQGFEVLQEEFGFGLNAPAEIVIDGDIGSSAMIGAIDALTASLDTNDSFGPATMTSNPASDLALLSVPLTVGPSTEAGIAAVRGLRDGAIPRAFAGVQAEVFVTGITAEEIDFIDIARQFLPIVIAIVLFLSFMLLTLVFRSIVIAATAVVLNLLSVTAGYGILVLVWQKGVGNELFGFPQVDIIQAWLPVMMFAILFGLSMDYQVFLISRIRERYLQTRNNEASITYGLRSTGKLITGAALIMVAIFSGFAAGDLVPISQFGFGMAVAILLDATIVRMVLVPAAMKLIGDWNWYLPSVLRKLPELQVEVVEPLRPPLKAEA